MHKKYLNHSKLLQAPLLMESCDPVWGFPFLAGVSKHVVILRTLFAHLNSHCITGISIFTWIFPQFMHTVFWMKSKLLHALWQCLLCMSCSPSPLFLFNVWIGTLPSVMPFKKNLFHAVDQGYPWILRNTANTAKHPGKFPGLLQYSQEPGFYSSKAMLAPGIEPRIPRMVGSSSNH
jgi:hypothetical protein